MNWSSSPRQGRRPVRFSEGRLPVWFVTLSGKQSTYDGDVLTTGTQANKHTHANQTAKNCNYPNEVKKWKKNRLYFIRFQEFMWTATGIIILIQYSTFYSNSEYILKILEKYKDSVCLIVSDVLDAVVFTGWLYTTIHLSVKLHLTEEMSLKRKQLKRKPKNDLLNSPIGRAEHFKPPLNKYLCRL